MIHINAAGTICAAFSDKDEFYELLTHQRLPSFSDDNQLLIDGSHTTLASLNTNLDKEGKLIEEKGLSTHNSRNNRLLLKVALQLKYELKQAINKYGPDRIACIVGTSTSGQDEADGFISGTIEPNTYHYPMQELGDPALFLAEYLGITGPAYCVSSACTSSARALISASRILRSKLCDCVIVAGCDTINRMTVNGFHSMSVLSPSHCKPFSKQRSGINIGEGAGIMLLSNDPSSNDVIFKGYGESSDAYHVSSPDPQGLGAFEAMRQALARAQLESTEIDYINLHGTGTILNDAMEATAVSKLFNTVLCSSTKHLTGHTLGASGIIEAIILYYLLLNDSCPLPYQDFSQGAYDDTLGEFGILHGQTYPTHRLNMMSNSFAFGGNNVSLILGRA